LNQVFTQSLKNRPKRANNRVIKSKVEQGKSLKGPKEIRKAFSPATVSIVS